MVEEVFVIPTSFAQQRLWFLDQLEPGNPVYNIPAALRLTGRLDVALLERSFGEVLRRHEVLRTGFAETDGEPVQLISPSAVLELPVTDLSGLAPDEQARRVHELTAEAARFVFDLESRPLMRAGVLRLGEEEHVLLLTMHHIVSDAWSVSVLVRELAALYEAYARGGESPLPELPVQYSDYALWQRQHLTGEVLEEQLGYWRRQLAGAPPLLPLPTDRPRPAASSFRGAAVPLTLPAELTGALRRLAQREGTTLFMTLLAAFQTLLSRYTGETDIVVGTPIAGRTQAETKELVGFFVNTLALRTDLSGDPTFAELLGRVRDVALGAYAHQEVPFERVVEEVRPERSLNHAPLFQVMLSLNNAPHEEFQLFGLKLRLVEPEITSSKFDLTLSLDEQGGTLSGSLVYSADLFDEATAARLAAHFERLLRAAASDPSRRLSALPLLSEGERRRQVEEWNRTGRDFGAGVTLDRLVSEQAARTPEAVAVVAGDERLTYAELDARAELVGRYLRHSGVRAEARVGVLMERGVGMVVAILGVLKAGGAYVPLDSEYPEARLRWMMEDAGVGVLLTEERLLGAAARAGGRVVCLDRD
nr:condensation domain-containing protein [uncultured bacterium]